MFLSEGRRGGSLQKFSSSFDCQKRLMITKGGLSDGMEGARETRNSHPSSTSNSALLCQDSSLSIPLQQKRVPAYKSKVSLDSYVPLHCAKASYHTTSYTLNHDVKLSDFVRLFDQFRQCNLHSSFFMRGQSFTAVKQFLPNLLNFRPVPLQFYLSSK